jgi:hypothetical protein
MGKWENIDQVVVFMWERYRALIAIHYDSMMLPPASPRYMVEFTRLYHYTPGGNSETESGLYHHSLLDATCEAAQRFIGHYLEFESDWMSDR